MSAIDIELSTWPPGAESERHTVAYRCAVAESREPRAQGREHRARYSIGPPFRVCGTPSAIHFGSGAPIR